MGYSEIVILIHGYHWASDRDDCQLGPGIRLLSLTGTRHHNLYNRLCLGLGLDDGEPFGYELGLELEAKQALDVGNPYAVPDRVCNLLVVLCGSAILHARMIWTEDAFRTSASTDMLYRHVSDSPLWDLVGWPTLDDQKLDELERAWKISQQVWRRKLSRGRVVNALTYFYYAWRSPYPDQVCLNLAITLESLFAPHISGETTHQIAFNISHFVGGTSERRAEVYKRVKDFYRLRSAVVHGGIPDDSTLYETALQVFELVRAILRRVLLEETLATTFEDESRRRRMFEEYLFGR